MNRRVALEAQAAALCGERIAQVRYLEIAYENGQAEWDRYADRFHTLDYGLELEMESGQVYSIVWDWEFAEYGITVQPGSSQDDIQNCAVSRRDHRSRPGPGCCTADHRGAGVLGYVGISGGSGLYR